MAPNSITILYLLVAAMVFTASAADQLKETDMSLYFQHWGVIAGLNATSIPVAGLPSRPWSGSQFGTIYVHDDPITEGPDHTSTAVGKSQGIHVTASTEGKSSLSLFSIDFTSGPYKGSTLQVFGNARHNEQVKEVSVVSGTGKFRFARGYATLESYFSYNPTDYRVIRCNISVLHY